GREAHDTLEGHHPAVDDRQAGGDATRLDILAVVAADACTASEIQCETAPAQREMASLGLESAYNVIVVISQIRISRSVHVRLSTTGVANSFRCLSSRHAECGRARTPGRPRDALGSRSAQQACRFNSRCPGIGPRRPVWDA